MLGELHIKNIGIIDEITINFDDGLNINWINTDSPEDTNLFSK